jgi:hypothetical protein
MDDTQFRLYRENSGITAKTNTWFSVAGSIEEISAIADKFEEEKASQSKIIAARIKAAIPRFEAGEEVSQFYWTWKQFTKLSGRNVDVRTTASPAKPLLLDRSQAFRSTRVGLVASV